MTCLKFYEQLKSMGITVLVSGNSVRLRGPRIALTDELVSQAKRIKKELVKKSIEELQPKIWRVKTSGRVITVIDPNHTPSAKFKLQMADKFGNER